MNLMWMWCPSTHVEKKRDFFRECWTVRYALSPRRCFQSDQIGKSGDVAEDVGSRFITDTVLEKPALS